MDQEMESCHRDYREVKLKKLFGAKDVTWTDMEKLTDESLKTGGIMSNGKRKRMLNVVPIRGRMERGQV